MAKQFTLGKNERLKSRKQIEQLFRKGKTISVFPFHVYYLFLPAAIPNSSNASIISGRTLQFGVGVSGKNFKKAVHRNRIKRLIREAYRLQKKELQNAVISNHRHLNLFFIYTAKQLPGFSVIKEKVNVILNRLMQISHENNSSNS